MVTFLKVLPQNDSWADPERLLQFVWFSLCFHFGWGGRGGWRQLSKHSFGLKTDDSGPRYVTEIQIEQTKNYQGGSKQKDQAYSDVRMYKNLMPLDPVGSLKLYISRLHPSRQALFQTPHKPLKTYVCQHIPKAKIPPGLEKSLQFPKHCRIIFSL